MVMAQPLFVSWLDMGTSGTHNLVISRRSMTACLRSTQIIPDGLRCGTLVSGSGNGITRMPPILAGARAW